MKKEKFKPCPDCSVIIECCPDCNIIEKEMKKKLRGK